MKLLLDTHLFLWYITADPKLPANLRAAIQDPDNEVYLSVASVWEAVIALDHQRRPEPGQGAAGGVADVGDEGGVPCSSDVTATGAAEATVT